MTITKVFWPTYPKCSGNDMDIFDWLDDNCRNEDDSKRWSYHDLILSFDDTDDALAFKLRFGL